MLLTEIADTSYKFTKTTDTNMRSTYVFYVKYEYRQKLKYRVDIFKYDDLYIIMFFSTLVSKNGAIILGSEEKETVTGTGNAFKIFSTVLQILKLEIEQNDDLNKIEFSADANEPSRVKLYDRFVKNIQKFLPGWELKSSKPNPNGPAKTIYVLEKE